MCVFLSSQGAGLGAVRAEQHPVESGGFGHGE